MNKTLKFAALGSALALCGVAAPVLAQSVPATKVAVVDRGRIASECTACRTADQALQQQVDAFKAREQQLQTQLKPEGESLQTAVNALNGKEPDAALKGRITAFQQKQQAAGRELQMQQAQIQRNQQYVGQQILEKLNALYKPAMQKRGANLLVDIDTTLAYDPSLDITNDVLTALNGALTTINTTAPAPQAPAGSTAPTGR